MAPAGLSDGVVIDPFGPSPVWLDLAGIVRISGVPGIRLTGPLAPRSVAEQHLYLDLLGWPKAGRNHAVTSTEAGLVARYTWEAAPSHVPSVRDFLLPDPLAQGLGGPEPSNLIDPVGWRVAADALASAVSVDPPRGQRSQHRALLDRAVSYLDEVLRFADGGQIPHLAFFTASGRRVHDLAPGRWELDRIRAVRQAWTELSARLGA